MNKSTLSILFLMVMLVSCSKEPIIEVNPETPVTKIVNFQIAQHQDYSDAQYNGVKAELRLVVSKDVFSNGKNVVLWDSTLALASLRDYPAMNTPLSVIKEFNGIYNSKEAFRVSSSIRYVDGNNQTYQVAKGETFSGITTYRIFEIRL